jgi:hypothetical protein
MSLKLNSSGGGSVTLQEPSTASNVTLDLPATSGTIQVSGAAISGTTGSFSGDLSFNSGYGSAAVAYGCRAWVNFNGTGTPAIRASGNVSSITDNGTGAYTVNFATTLPDANFSCAFSCAFAADGNDYATGGSTKTTTTCDVYVVNSGNGNRYDSSSVTAVIFR